MFPKQLIMSSLVLLVTFAFFFHLYQLQTAVIVKLSCTCPFCLPERHNMPKLWKHEEQNIQKRMWQMPNDILSPNEIRFLYDYWVTNKRQWKKSKANCKPLTTNESEACWHSSCFQSSSMPLMIAFLSSLLLLNEWMNEHSFIIYSPLYHT